MKSNIFPHMRALRGGVATVALIAGCAAMPAWAQEASAGTADADAAAGEQADVVVTGSRIVSPVATSASPLQVIDARAIDNAGVINVQSLLNQYAVVSAPRSSRTNSSFASSSAGIATVDLRNLGENRTLVLVNGRRMVSGVPGNFVVDLNVIPTGFIERVDILTGGASAVYGSDAVAGVVNFVYKKDFQGVEAGGQAGITERGDGFDRVFDLTLGRNFAGGRGNVMLYGSYSKEDPVRKADRNSEGGSMAVDSVAGIVVGRGAANAFVPVRPDLSAGNPRGRYMTGPSTTFTYDRVTGALRPCFSANGGVCNAPGSPFNGTQIGPDGFNRSEYRLLAIPIERFVGAMRGTFEVSPALNLFVEGNYARTNVSTIREPIALQSLNLRATASSRPPSGLIPIESRVGGVIYRNAFVPDAIYARAVDNDGDGLRDLQFDKRLTEFGPNRYEVKRDTFRIAGGANGEISPAWSYDISAVYGENKERQTGTGLYNGPNLLQALNAFVDVNDINGNGNRTEIICGDATARAAGCIPANIYGEGSLAPAAAYVGATQQLDTRVTQTVVTGTLSGKLFSLSGVNPVAVAVGGEYRRETSSSVFDALSQGGLNGNNATPSTRGAYSLVEGYGEVIVPLIEERPLVHSLLVRGAVRVSDYTTTGGAFSYNYGAEWAPIPDIRFRVMNARSVRAPNIDDLFRGAVQAFPSLADPCEGVTAAQTGALADNCRAASGVNANIAANGAFRTTSADRQSITSLVRGNPNLNEEKGNSFTAGVAITPRSLGGVFRNLLLTVDYFNIRIEDAIVVVSQQNLLNQCYRQSIAEACGLITRRGTAGANSIGALAQVDSAGVNSALLKTRGLDVAGTWRATVLGGEFGLRGSYTHLFEQYQILSAGGVRDQIMAEVGKARDRFTTSASWDSQNGPGVTLTGSYVGPSYIADELGGAKPGVNKAYRIHPEFYLDGQIRFNVDGGFQFYIGAYNLLDNKPPYLAEVGSNTGQDTNTGVYDALGRRFYAGARVRF